MAIHPAIKILVLLFSLGLASMMTWQLTKNIEGPEQEPAPEKEEAKQEPVEKAGAQAIHISPKSAGAIDMKDLLPAPPEDTEPDEKAEEDKEKSKQRPLMPSSKSRPMLPSSKSIVAPVFKE